MAKVSMPLAELVEKGAKDDVVRELLGHVAQRLMDFEIEQRTGAEYGERTEDRSKQPQRLTAIGCGKRAPARLICGSPSCVAAATSRHFSSRAAQRRKRS